MKIYFKVLILILIINSGCESDFLDRVPRDQPSDVTFYSNQVELTMAINSAYKTIQSRAFSSYQLQSQLDHATDIGWIRGGDDFKRLGSGEIDPSRNLIEGAWDNFYTGIGKCNNLLANMERAIANTDPDIFNRIEAEARFLRGYFYHRLISLYGSVPLVTENLDINNAQLAKTPKDEIVQFIYDEMDAAAAVLPASYSGDNKGRATKGAALSIKARTALFEGDWNTAAQASKEVIDLGIYFLYPDYHDLFQYEGEENNEVIFSVQYNRNIQGNNTHGLSQILRPRNAGGWATRVPTQYMIDSYYCIDGLRIDQSPLYDPANPWKNRDPRLKASIVLPGSRFLNINGGYPQYQYETHLDSVQIWRYDSPIDSTRISNQDTRSVQFYATFTGYNWRKYAYESRDFSWNQNELNYMLIRFPEILLIYAEAKMMLEQEDQSVYDAINQIRQRPSVLMPEVGPGDNIMDAIKYERKIELAQEGLRYFDLRRWGIAEEVMDGQIVYGGPRYGYLATFQPAFDQYGVPKFEGVYADSLRVVETRGYQSDLWPIPQKEIDINPNLVQNPNW